MRRYRRGDRRSRSSTPAGSSSGSRARPPAAPLDLSAPQSALKTAQGFLDLARNSEPVRPTIINEEIGRDRRVAFAATTLAALKSVAARAGRATVNDVVLAVSTGALRRLFEQRGAEIPGEFSALVPMSIRKPGEELALGNRITTLIVPLPLAEPDRRRAAAADPRRPPTG